MGAALPPMGGDLLRFLSVRFVMVVVQPVGLWDFVAVVVVMWVGVVVFLVHFCSRDQGCRLGRWVVAMVRKKGC